MPFPDLAKHWARHIGTVIVNPIACWELAEIAGHRDSIRAAVQPLP